MNEGDNLFNEVVSEPDNCNSEIDNQTQTLHPQPPE